MEVPCYLTRRPREQTVLLFTAVERYAAQHNALHHHPLELSAFQPDPSGYFWYLL
jgi:hypothetical protein